MNAKLKKIIIPFILMIVINLGSQIFMSNWDFGIFSPHVGIIFISGLLFGPYGALGSTLANSICDLINGYTPIETLVSEIFSFGISILAYKIWYTGLNRKHEITKPSLNNSYQLYLFIVDLLICAILYSFLHGNIIGIILSDSEMEYLIATDYLINFINISFIFGIISIWISKKIDFIHIPKTSKRKFNEKHYKIISYLLIPLTIVSGSLLFLPTGPEIIEITLILYALLLYAYLTKPLVGEVKSINENSISQKIMNIFLATTLIIVLVAIFLSFLLNNIYLMDFGAINMLFPTAPILVLADIIVIIFFIPGQNILRYIENRVITPISSFSEINEFIHKNQKIESDGLLNIYSNYINENNEIGTLARSHTELITYNNYYIENIREIESEKERIEAELDIARKIQQSNLPTEPIITNEYAIDGYSHPAKEVGGDFFDYYEIDKNNLAIVIGDASGKGVPAALLATITQTIIQQLFNTERDPSKILYLLNNQICKNNSESMFITLWLGVYNKSSKTITFSNAGHNPPLIREDNKYKYLEIESGVVLGILEDFEYEKEEVILSDEIILYTDGITDANNYENEMYGEERLANFFNSYNGKNPIQALSDDIHNFTGDSEQFDDMTLIILRNNHD
ncbi:PP2C family protein-serine/threonine phosphatase [Methanobrevibacter sp.]|uniref:PP2C family protein-serine/threonine phosphatase n=1 Tax=Methanobrevibacter sp. TaxID=66852 RepID=UPI00388F47F9